MNINKSSSGRFLRPQPAARVTTRRIGLLFGKSREHSTDDLLVTLLTFLSLGAYITLLVLTLRLSS